MVDPSVCNTIFCPPAEIQVVTHIKHLPLLKIKSFLHQKYVVEGLSINQLVTLTMSSKTTVKKYLVDAGIPIREEELSLGPPKYGERYHNGRKVPNKRDLEIMETIQDLSKKGISATQIAKLLCSMNLPTKNGGRWHAQTVIRILKKLGSS